MAIRLTINNRPFIPDVMFKTDNGVLNNRDLAADEQVSCEITIASIGEKTEYLGSYTLGSRKSFGKADEVKQVTVLQYNKCVSKHCKVIKGLEEFGIKNGVTLVNHVAAPELNDIIQEIFFKVNGIHADDADEETSDGELTQGE